MIFLSHPAFLWALAGLLIPIGIHLLSRKEGNVIYVGSIRHFKETYTQRFKSITLNEILLLTLRCLLLLFLIFWICGAQWPGKTKARKWLVIEKGIEGDDEIKSLFDSLKQDGFEMRYLEDGFPFVSDTTSTSSSMDYWKLAEQLELQHLDEAVVFSYSRIDALKGKRINLPSSIHWISQPTRSIDYPVHAIRLRNDSVILRMGHSTREATSFTTVIAPAKSVVNHNAIPISSMDTLTIMLISDQAFSYDRKIMLAILETIHQEALYKIKITEGTPEKFKNDVHADWVIWLSQSPLPPKLFGKILVVREQDETPILVRQSAQLYFLTKRLYERNVIQNNLTLQLLNLLHPSLELWRMAFLKDRRMANEKMMWAPATTNREDNTYQSSVDLREGDTYWFFMFLMVLIIERLVAYKRNQ